MEWYRLKSIIILILLLLNAFLLVLVGMRYTEAAKYDRTALNQTLEVLEARGIQADPDSLSPAESLPPLTMERDLEAEQKLAAALLGSEVDADNQGGGLYLYRSKLGELSLRAGGELSAQLAQDEHWRTDSPESHAAGLLRAMELTARQTGVTTQGTETVVRFRQLLDRIPVFSCEVEFVYEDGVLSAIHGTLIAAGPGTAEAGQPLNLPTALMRFSEEIAAAGDVCTVIHSMEPGYRGTAQSLSGGARLAPVWLVTTDTARYYLDCAAGGLTRVE